MPPPPITGKVVQNHRRADSLYSLQVAADIDGFEAGQFGRIGLAIGGENIMRPYSFVNAPDENPLEFYFSIVPDGPLSGRLAKLQSGDDILINRKANGFLVLSQVPEAAQLWLVATGTGLGPFLSILKGAEVWRRHQTVILVHAVRLLEDLTYREDIGKMTTKHNGEGGAGRLIYAPFVSREETDFALPGRIPAALTNGALAKFAGVSPSPDNAQFMLCGNPQMVKDATAVLLEQGFRRNRRREPGHITMENYW
ncbi:MAG: ferredoxin--NADP reductase [Gammaproteobacteria bacterium]